MAAPDFAMLIGKRMDKKGGGDGPPPGGPPGLGEPDGDEGGMDKEQVENSAIADFMSAQKPEEAKDALKQFLEACYPQLAGGDGDGDEGGAGPGY